MAGDSAQLRESALAVQHWNRHPLVYVEKNLGVTLWKKQKEIIAAIMRPGVRRVAVKSSHGVGKALALSTPLPTPSGWTTMGETKIGDELLDEKGTACTVTSTSEIEKGRRCFRITFDDGTQITASDEHLWDVLDMKARGRLRQKMVKRKNPIRDWRHEWEHAETLSTEKMASLIKTNCGQRNLMIPCTEEIVGHQKSPPIPAYTFGAWLGDGTSANASITCGNDDIDELIANVQSDGFVMRERPSQRQPGCKVFGILGLHAILGKLQLFNNKHILPKALRASPGYRFALLQGLMDTDGFTVAGGGMVGIELTNRHLADGVAELAATFGWKVFRSTKKAKLYEKEYGTVYRTWFSPDRIVFRLKRKADKQKAQMSKGAQRSRHTGRTIASIEEIESVPVKCVAVDSSRNLYLAGSGFVPTHNTFVAATAALTWLLTGQDRLVITTAPTWRQVKELLWKEIRGIVAACEKRGMPVGATPLPSAPELRITDQWMAIGFASDNPVNMQGWHSTGGTLVVIDEANGVEPPLWDALQGVLTGANDRLLAIANPTESAGPFFNLWKDDRAVKFSISAYDTPNVQQGRAVIPGVVTREWVEDRKREWGEGSALFRSRVLGEFPDKDDGLVPLAWIEAGNRQHDRLTTENGWKGHAVLGVDVARYGPDSTVAAIAYQQGVRSIMRFRKADTMETVQWILSLVRECPDITDVQVDADGLGAGVFDALKQHLGGRAIELRGGMSALMADRYANRRAEWYWTLRERLDPTRNKIPFAIPNVDALTTQLQTIGHTLGNKGRITLESKDDIRRRIGQSPDEADAVAYACAQMDHRRGRDVAINLTAGYRANPWSV